MYRRLAVFSCSLFLVGISLGCGNKPAADRADSSGNQKAPSFFGGFTAKPVVIPAGTVITVRLGEAVGSKTSTSGDSFSAEVAEPVEVAGRVVLPSGAPASGHVVEAVPEGRFKGGARLRLALDSITANGTKYEIETNALRRSLKGKGERTAAMIGGGAGGGALIGALAGGGKGALIGGLVGAGAGTAGAAYTGNRNIVLPAESALSFKLVQSITVKM
jgi:hypothetical protein